LRPQSCREENQQCVSAGRIRRAKTGEVNWIIETKGRVWEGTAAKDDAIKDWCERVSAATGAAWRYVPINQIHFDGRRLASLAQLLDEA
jgi:hypothetical protein